MNANKIENRFETDFQQPKTGLPKTGVDIPNGNNTLLPGCKVTCYRKE